MSRCLHYVIGADSVLCHMEYESRHVIRSSNLGWAEILEIGHKPEINPYWTYHYFYARDYKKGCN